MNKRQIAITLGIVCLILTMAIIVQVRTTRKSNQIVSQSLANDDLRDQVLKWKEKYDIAYSDLEDAEERLESIRQSATENTEGSKEKEEELKKNNMIIGLTDVEGPGVIVTMKDDNTVTAETINPADDISLHLVHYSDILTIVNELENAGAEAISVNGQRIVSSTSISCEGTVININGEKIGSPFTIKAIGNSLLLYSALLRAGGFVERLNSTGIQTVVKQSENIEIPKYTGVISSKNLKYAD